MYASDLSFRHQKDAPYFFKNISFNLEQGKLHALHGKNGTGKSVLLSLLNEKMDPKSIVEGKIHTTGKTLLVNQCFDQMIADKFTFIENLQFACMEQYPSLIRPLNTPFFHLDFIEKFHIDITKPVYMLSGGQRQILALLMVIQKPVKILLLDEPTATLDEENALLVFEFLRILTERNITILVVCHDRELVSGYVTGQNLYMIKKENGLRTIMAQV